MHEQIDLIKLKKDDPQYKQQLFDLRDKIDPVALDIFKNELFFALLHACCQHHILDKVLEQIDQKGISYILCKVSPEAKKFREWARQVKMERQRAISYIRLQPVEIHQSLVGEFEVQHKTENLIMLHFMQRFPTYNIVIFFGQQAYIARNGEIFNHLIKEKPKLPQIKDEFEGFWRAFYRSQYIPERRNLTYLKRMLPKKYWKWVPELQSLLIRK